MQRGMSSGNTEPSSSQYTHAPEQHSTSASTARVSSSPPECTTDYQCGFGNVCAKPGGSYTGTCAKGVNSYGNPTFTPPRLDSIGPGRGQCSFDTDCPVGFKCIKGSSLTGNCMK
jgi:hypothetical protein